MFFSFFFQVRRGFLRKVYGLLSIQLLLTGAMICMFLYIEPINEMALESNWLYWVSSIVFLVVLITLICSKNLVRKSPANLICLFILTSKYIFTSVGSTKGRGITRVVDVTLFLKVSFLQDF